MTRRLPWARDSVKPFKGETKSEPKSPRSPTPPRTPARQTPQPSHTLTSRASERKPTASGKSASRHPDRTPSTSPPPQPIPETFLIPGYDHDDIYRMVEDEFLVIAGKFTAHLHAAEYQRLKTQARYQNADAIADISRPVVGSLTELARRRQEDLLRRKRQQQALRQSKAGDGGEAGETEEADDALWRGSSLQGLMDSPRKREVRISALARAESSAGRTGASWDREGGVQRRLNFSGEEAVKRPRPEETADEDEDDLDVPARLRSSPQRMAEPTSSRSKATGFQAASLSLGHAKSVPAKSGNATIETMAPHNVEKTNDKRNSDSEEDDIFTRFKSRQTSDRRRRPAAQKKAEGKGDAEGDIIPSFMS
ncbi:hypothetical protein HYQ45_012723 [Verticillium longisporum]|uniref:Uncharacterized protein n=1 Tax=Verticillium longisporum TaxID=100787 RepID=A0A8I3AK32_VERLO|nr:hypothetical protein HYQ45_012723 [Verticillium longisporum]